MKKIMFLAVIAVFLFSGNAMAAVLSGHWAAVSYCVSKDYPPTAPQEEISEMTIVQQGEFFATLNDDGVEVCGGIINGKLVYLTCPPRIDELTGEEVGTGTFFQGELRGNTIVGINTVPDDGKTCSVVAVRD